MPVVSPPTTPTHVHGATRFTSLATPTRGEACDTSVWRVDIAPNTSPTLHRVTREEIFVVLAGGAQVRLGDARHEVVAGQVIVVPADTDFELATTDQPLSAICCLPVGGQAYLPAGARPAKDEAGSGAPFTPPWAQ